MSCILGECRVVSFFFSFSFASFSLIRGLRTCLALTLPVGKAGISISLYFPFSCIERSHSSAPAQQSRSPRVLRSWRPWMGEAHLLTLTALASYNGGGGCKVSEVALSLFLPTNHPGASCCRPVPGVLFCTAWAFLICFVQVEDWTNKPLAAYKFSTAVPHPVRFWPPLASLPSFRAAGAEFGSSWTLAEGSHIAFAELTVRKSCR